MTKPDAPEAEARLPIALRPETVAMVAATLAALYADLSGQFDFDFGDGELSQTRTVSGGSPPAPQPEPEAVTRRKLAQRGRAPRRETEGRRR